MTTTGGQQEYIWIVRWKDFQHYTPQRDRGPAWIKDYVDQLDDERYWNLTDRQRALLADLRRIFAATRAQLPRDTRVISRRRQSQTFSADLEALNQAGFIHFCSREGLEQRLEELYASRAPARSRDTDGETEKKKGTRSGSTPTADANGHGPDLPLEQLITAARATGSSTTSIRNAARGLPEASITKALESLTSRKSRPHNPIGYVIAALRHEREELQHVRDQARKSLGLNEPLPGEPSAE